MKSIHKKILDLIDENKNIEKELTEVFDYTLSLESQILEYKNAIKLFNYNLENVKIHEKY